MTVYGMTRMTGAGLDDWNECIWSDWEDWNECIWNDWSDWEDRVTGMTRMTGRTR